VAGVNVVAVEIHQSKITSSDISFDLALAGTGTGSTSATPALLTRGPYLQMASQSAVTLRWRTDKATDSKIEVGTSVGTYTFAAINSTITTEHEVRISGLSPDTKYFYRFGSSTRVLQGGVENFFYTAPLASSPGKIRVAGIMLTLTEQMRSIKALFLSHMVKQY
jgi:phosphodiesterase/alkaline phosphatase D-like protein